MEGLAVSPVEVLPSPDWVTVLELAKPVCDWLAMLAMPSWTIPMAGTSTARWRVPTWRS